jgi:hypothetical protein
VITLLSPLTDSDNRTAKNSSIATCVYEVRQIFWKIYLNANWISRGFTVVPIILPNLDAATLCYRSVELCPLECAEEPRAKLESGIFVDAARGRHFGKGHIPVELPRAENTAELEIPGPG